MDNDRERTAFVAYAITICFAYAMDVTSPCVCGRLRRASRALTRLYDEALEPTGLTVTQFAVLRTLARSKRPTLAELAEATAHEKSALWRILQPLLRKGWAMSSSTGGERSQRLELTPAGWAKLEEATPHWGVAKDRVSAALGPREAALIELLSEVEAHV